MPTRCTPDRSMTRCSLLLLLASAAATLAASVPVDLYADEALADARRALGAAGSGAHLSVNQRVIRGDDATPHEHNFMVALFYSNGAGGMYFTCGGARTISNRCAGRG